MEYLDPVLNQDDLIEQIEAIQYTTNPVTIQIGANFSISEEIVIPNRTSSGTVDIVPHGGNRTLTRTPGASGTGRHFVVEGIVNLRGSGTNTLTFAAGADINTTENLGGFDVPVNGQLFVWAGTIIRNNRAVSGGGIGVIDNQPSGSVFIYGGDIRNNFANRGGGVFVHNGIFQMGHINEAGHRVGIIGGGSGQGNHAEGAGGEGGGIALSGTTSGLWFGGSVSNNTIITPSTDAPDIAGRGIWVSSNATLTFLGNMTNVNGILNDGVITVDNTATLNNNSRILNNHIVIAGVGNIMPAPEIGPAFGGNLPSTATPGVIEGQVVSGGIFLNGANATLVRIDQSGTTSTGPLGVSAANGIRETTTSGDGRYVFGTAAQPLPAGTYVVVISGPLFNTVVTTPVTITDNTSEGFYVGQMGVVSGTPLLRRCLIVRLSFSTGVELTDIVRTEVNFEPSAGARRAFTHHHPQAWILLSPETNDANGGVGSIEFFSEGFARTDNLLSVTGPNYAARNSRVVVHQIQINRPQAGRVEGGIWPESAGRSFRGINGVFCSLFRGDTGARINNSIGAGTPLLTDTRGRFRFTGVPAGEHTVVFTKPGFSVEMRRITVPDGQGITLEQQNYFENPSAPSRTLIVQLTNTAAGAARRLLDDQNTVGTRVTIGTGAGQLLTPPSVLSQFWHFSDNNPVGQVVVQRPDYIAQTTPTVVIGDFTAANGHVHPVQVGLQGPAPRQVLGRISADDHVGGAPVVARITLVNALSGATRIENSTATDGAYEFLNVEPGDYHVITTAAGRGARISRRITITETGPGQVVNETLFVPDPNLPDRILVVPINGERVAGQGLRPNSQQGTSMVRVTRNGTVQNLLRSGALSNPTIHDHSFWYLPFSASDTLTNLETLVIGFERRLTAAPSVGANVSVIALTGLIAAQTTVEIRAGGTLIATEANRLDFGIARLGTVMNRSAELTVVNTGSAIARIDFNDLAIGTTRWRITQGAGFGQLLTQNQSATVTVFFVEEGFTPGTSTFNLQWQSSHILGATANGRGVFQVLPATGNADVTGVRGIIRATPTGQGVAGVRITLVNLTTGATTAHATSNAAGAYSITPVPAATYLPIFSSGNPQRRARISDTNLIVAANSLTILDRADLSEGQTESRVLISRFDTTETIPGLAAIRLTGGGAAERGLARRDTFNLWTQTSGRGNNLNGGIGTLIASKPGSITQQRVVAEGDYDADTAIFFHTFDSASLSGGVIKGTINRPNGSPAAGARVSLIQLHPNVGVNARRDAGPTGSDGAYSFGEETPDPILVEPGHYRIVVTLAGHNAFVSDVIVMAEGTGLERNLQLEAGDRTRILLVRFGDDPRPDGASMTLNGAPMNPPPILEDPLNTGDLWYRAVPAGGGTGTLFGVRPFTEEITAAEYVHNFAFLSLA